MLDIKSSDYGFTRQVTGAVCCVCKLVTRCAAQEAKIVNFWVLYLCHLLRSNQPEPILQLWVKYHTAPSISLTSFSVSVSRCPPPSLCLFSLHCSGSQLWCRGKAGVKMERDREWQTRKSWEDGCWEMEIGLRKRTEKEMEGGWDWTANDYSSACACSWQCLIPNQTVLFLSIDTHRHQYTYTHTHTHWPQAFEFVFGQCWVVLGRRN